MKLRLPRRRIARAAIYLGSLLLVLVAVDLVLVQVRRTIHHGFDTTRIVSPLQPDGRIDYLLAVDEQYGRGVTPENNAAVLVLQALGRGALPSNQPADGITERMGMPHLPEEGDYFVAYSKYLQDHGKPGEDLRLADPIHWPVTISPPAREWVQANEKPLNLMVTASQRSRFFIPCYGGYRPETLFQIQLPHLAGMKNAHLALRTRSLMKLEAGDIGGFRDDLLAMLRFGRLLTQATTLIDRLVGLAMERSACRTARAAAVSGTLPPDQLKALRDEFAGLPELSPVTECINSGERYLALDLMQTLARVGPRRAGELIALTSEELVAFNSSKDENHLSRMRTAAIRFVPIPYEKSMRTLNSLYDGAVVASQEPSFPRRKEALKLWDDEIERLRSHNPVGGFLTGYWPAQLILPFLRRGQLNAESAVVDSQLTQLALALAAYKADHHAYPAALADLAPGYLPSVPLDRFSEKPLIYQATTEGYTLYSVGPNGLDNGGAFSPPDTLFFSGQESSADDISADFP